MHTLLCKFFCMGLFDELYREIVHHNLLIVPPLLKMK